MYNVYRLYTKHGGGTIENELQFRGQTNAFSLGNRSVVLTIPKDIAEEFEINTTEKKTFFDIYTDYSNNKKRIIFEFTKHAKKIEG